MDNEGKTTIENLRKDLENKTNFFNEIVLF